MTECTHIFICTNQKTKGKCCAQYNSCRIFDYFRVELNRRSVMAGHKRFKVVKTSCLGRCAYGPNIFIPAENVWYTFSSTEDIDEIIESHLINGNIVEHLINLEKL